MKLRCASVLLSLCQIAVVQAFLKRAQTSVSSSASDQSAQGAELRAATLRLNAHLQRVANSLEPGPTRDLLRTLRLCAKCSDYERFGEGGDGGYVMCADGLQSGLLGAMSYGISGYDGWGMDVAKRFHVPLHEYDCTNTNQPAVCEGCKVSFHPTCIASVKDKPKARYQSLAQNLKDAGFTTNNSVLLKIDVESAEWDVFKDEPVSTFRMFREIVVEYHGLEYFSWHEVYLLAAKKLEDAGFRVAHLHGNNYGGGLVHFGEFSIPKVLEVTYIRSEGCATGIPYGVSEDMPNDSMRQELEDAHLPS